MFYYSKFTQIARISGLIWEPTKIFVNYYSKPSIVLTKLINKTKTRRGAWKDFEELAKPASVMQGPQNPKRITVLNKLFMRHISDLMASGNCSEKILGLGVQVTKVKITSDFSIVNVYWVSYGPLDETEVARILSQTAGMLREELTLLHVVGKVPTIKFVRDRSHTSWSQVENLLNIADMGEDYVPRGAANLKDDFGNENPGDSTSDLPTMRQNVLGVDREAMLERILSNMRGGKSTFEKSVPVSVAGQYQMFDQEAFASFLRQRKIMREKAEKYSKSDLRFADDSEGREEFEENLVAIEDEDYLDDDEYIEDPK